jgi:predicted alpha/beta-hydrolase family hydrolase
VIIRSGDGELAGDLTVPAQPVGVVVFAHGSGSSRSSPRNRAVAEVLQRSGFATLLLDARVRTAVEQIREHRDVPELPVGLFGASTGAAAALVAAANDHSLRAVVSRGGRPDLAGAALRRVRAPTLLIVGSRDEQVLELNRQAKQQLTAVSKIEVVEGATHLFEELGALEQVARLAAEWFRDHLAS